MPTATLDDLKKVIALSDLPDEHLQWILDRAAVLEFEDSALIAKTGEPAELMYFILEGRIDFYLDVNGRLVFYFYFSNDHTTGGAGGLLPYSRMKTYAGCSYAVGKLRVLALHKKHFPELERLNPAFIQKLIGYMTERAKAFATTKMQHEKVSALGKLAAGIAHELNNPASAIDRISHELVKRLRRNYGLTEKLLQHQVSREHIQSIRTLVETKELEPSLHDKLTSLQRMEKEDAITDWLEDNGMLGNHIAGETFAEAGFTGDDLAEIRDRVGKEPFIHVLHWLENLLSSQRILKDLGDASGRISNLVGAIKSHVHMDRTDDLHPTDIHQDIENTLTLLGFKLREKNIEIVKHFCDDLPLIPVHKGELNQVWTNIIDNAIYAMTKNGVLTIETTCDEKNVNVIIADNGCGIPREIMSRIFDPFFTTKKVGDGTGIGLDLVNRIVKRHHGEIKVACTEGRTEFKVCIPLEQGQKTTKN